MKLAWFTPLARRSAIGQQSINVIRSLAKHAEVVIYGSAISTRADALDTEQEVRLIQHVPTAELLEQLAEFDCVVYALGDNLEFHRQIYEVARRYPGVVILHDLVMHHFFAGYFLESGKDTEAYVRELGFAHGKDGERFGRSVASGEAGNVWDTPAMLDYPMALSAVHGALGVVVHSRFAHTWLEGKAASPILRLDFPEPSYLRRFATSTLTDSKRGAKDGVRLVTFGLVNPNKMVAEIIETIGRNPALRTSVVYDVVGTTSHDPGYERRLKSAIREFSLEDQVRLHGYQPDDRLFDLVNQADVVINLRNPHFGESSASLVDALYLGKPTIVWNHGYYAEFPDQVVVRVSSIHEAERQLQRLVADSRLRVHYAHDAQSYATATFNTDRYVEQFLQFARLCRYNKPVLSLIDSVSIGLDELGISPESNLADEVVATIGAFAGDAPKHR